MWLYAVFVRKDGKMFRNCNKTYCKLIFGKVIFQSGRGRERDGRGGIGLGIVNWVAQCIN